MQDWIGILKKEFEHPAIVLWRAVELRHIDEFLNKYELSSPVLDLGCAEGKIADILFKNKALIGLDNCWELLSQNKKIQFYKALILTDGCRMPFKNSSFGSVFSNCVIEHIPDVNALLDEVSRVLREKEIFLFTVPSHKFAEFLFFTKFFNKLRLKRLARWYGRKRNKQLNHFHCYDHNAWRNLLKEKGLKLIEYRYYMSEEATSVWDFLAALFFLFKKTIFLSCFEKKVKDKISTGLKKDLDQECEFGAWLLIVLSKKYDA